MLLNFSFGTSNEALSCTSARGVLGCTTVLTIAAACCMTQCDAWWFRKKAIEEYEYKGNIRTIPTCFLQHITALCFNVMSLACSS